MPTDLTYAPEPDAPPEPVGFIAPALLAAAAQLVLEVALERELVRHLGYDRYDVAGRNRLNSRNGVRPKRVVTDVGTVRIAVPRDRDGTFEPAIVRKRQQRRPGLHRLVTDLLTGASYDEVARRVAVLYQRSGDRGLVPDVAAALIAELSALPSPLREERGLWALHVGSTRLSSFAGRTVVVAAAIGVRGDGGLSLLALRRSTPARTGETWSALVGGLAARSRLVPELVVCADDDRLLAAVAESWPAAAVQVVSEP